MNEIFYPVVALVALTVLVLLLIPINRFRAGFQGRVKVKDFRYGESPGVPGDVSLPNRNFMNLLFYVTRTVVLALLWVRFALALK